MLTKLFDKDSSELITTCKSPNSCDLSEIYSPFKIFEESGVIERMNKLRRHSPSALWDITEEARQKMKEAYRSSFINSVTLKSTC